jgi:hypothetical protein
MMKHGKTILFALAMALGVPGKFSNVDPPRKYYIDEREFPVIHMYSIDPFMNVDPMVEKDIYGVRNI